MRLRFLIRRPLVLALVLGTCLLSALGAQSEAGKARIALYEPVGQKQDGTLTAVLSTMADSVEMSLVVLDRYEVRRLAAADPARDLEKIRSYCEANRIDQAILGSGTARKGGGYDFRLVVYNRQSDSITVDRKGSSTGALDMFDVTDALVVSLLDGLSGMHLLYGSLTVQSDPSGATVAVNGKTVGKAPLSLRGLPVGAVELTAELDGHETATETLTIADGSTSNARLSLPRSTGTLVLVVPKDAVVEVKSAEIGQKEVRGPGGTGLPTGDYEVQASCPGLPSVSTRVTISRGSSSQVLPWKRGYLDIHAVPAGATIVVDGIERGVAPLIVETEPGPLHQVELKLPKYQTYRTDISTDAGDKTLLSGALTPLPGSIRVETSIAGADVVLDPSDNSPDTDMKGVTPAVFHDLAPGTHVVRIAEIRVGNRLYTCGAPFQIEVKPDEEIVVSRTFAQGMAHLVIPDAAAGSALWIDGRLVDSEQVFASGIETPAGTMELSINGPHTQRWTGTTSVGANQNLRQSIYSMIWRLPRRNIVVDGKTDDWEGLLPVWIPSEQIGLPDQPGTSIAKGFACRDDRFLYFRYDFSDGSPQAKLPKEFRDELDYTQIIDTTDGEIRMITRFRSGASATTTMGIYNGASHSWRGLGDNTIKFAIGESTLEIAVPLGPIKAYLKGASSLTMVKLLVVRARPSDSAWLSSPLESGERMVDLDF